MDERLLSQIRWYKLGTLLVYVGMVCFMVYQPLSWMANISQGFAAMILVVHTTECYLYRDLVKKAPGRRGWHWLNVFLFGMMHKPVMRITTRRARQL